MWMDAIFIDNAIQPGPGDLERFASTALMPAGLLEHFFYEQLLRVVEAHALQWDFDRDTAQIPAPRQKQGRVRFDGLSDGLMCR